jgi:hypothetical protein
MPSMVPNIWPTVARGEPGAWSSGAIGPSVVPAHEPVGGCWLLLLLLFCGEQQGGDVDSSAQTFKSISINQNFKTLINSHIHTL